MLFDEFNGDETQSSAARLHKIFKLLSLKNLKKKKKTWLI